MSEQLRPHLFPLELVHFIRVDVVPSSDVEHGVPSSDVEQGALAVGNHGAPYERDLHVLVVLQEALGAHGVHVHGPLVVQAAARYALGQTVNDNLIKGIHFSCLTHVFSLGVATAAISKLLQVCPL